GPSQEDIPTLGKTRDTLVKQIHLDLDQLKSGAVEQEKSFNELYEHLLTQKSVLASTPSIWPVRGWVTSGFGYRTSPFTGLKEVHTGIDIANNHGTPVIAPADGVVVRIVREAGLGKFLTINHGYGIMTRYGHLSEVYVSVGKRVKRGEKISAVGNTGRTTGPHLHYEVAANGVLVNPERYILN
ncbi:MAG: M23 family metallopeptidase, partial [Deltaproteobacteria bacterium]|nr:M23 family metallopeptidase [Deltaproteobacteria bacterium]